VPKSLPRAISSFSFLRGKNFLSYWSFSTWLLVIFTSLLCGATTWLVLIEIKKKLRELIGRYERWLDKTLTRFNTPKDGGRFDTRGFDELVTQKPRDVNPSTQQRFAQLYSEIMGVNISDREK
jgi:hypothetical protein